MSTNALKIAVSYDKVGIAIRYQWDLYLDGVFYQSKHTTFNNTEFDIFDHLVIDEIRIKLTIFYKGGSYQLSNDFVYNKIPVIVSEAMITEWSLTTDNTISLPLPTVGTYDFIVDWGDGNTNPVTAYNSGNSHTYATSGIKTVSISGLMTHWSFNNTGDKLKITSVLSGGYTGLTNLSSGFRGCSNLTFIENNPIWTKSVTALSELLKECVSFNSPVSDWDVSKVSNFYGVFNYATSFNQPVNDWDVSNGVYFGTMFSNNPVFNQPLTSWNVSAIQLNNMFYDCTSFNQDISSWDISNVVTMANMLNFTAWSSVNYDLALNSWASQSVPSGITFDCSPTQYTAAGAAARAILTNAPNNWIINDGGLAP